MIPDNIKDLAGELNYLYVLAYHELKLRVRYIIENRITDPIVIEKILDSLLNIPTDKCHQLLIKLCGYYAQFNEQAALEYLELYQELYGEEDDLPKKKTK